METFGTITLLLSRMRSGDKSASTDLFAHVYGELKRIASSLLASRAYPAWSFEKTALVHSACVRLLERERLIADDRRQFFFLFSRAMQDVLVEQARSDLAIKRGGGRRQTQLTDVGLETQSFSTGVLDVNDALEALKQHDPDAAEVIALKFFGGRSLNEIAELTGSTFAVVRRNWEYARTWMHERLSSADKSR